MRLPLRRLNLVGRIDDFKDRIEALENGISEMNASLEALGNLLEAMS